jgi:hypothetical protein
MKIKFQTVYFLIGLTIGSFGLQQLSTMGGPRHTEEVASVKKEIILGHRIGPMGSEMLVTR